MLIFKHIFFFFILFCFISWHKTRGYCWSRTDSDCRTQKPSIVKGEHHDNQGWYCFVVKKSSTQLEARNCSETLKYICEQGITCGKRHSE